MGLPEAEAMYRKFVAESKKPEAVLVLAEYFGRGNRTDEALELCDQAWKTSPPALVAASSLAILYAAKDGKPYCDRVERRLQEAMQKAPRQSASAFLQQLAALRNLQGRYDEAEKLFRQVIDQDKDNLVALNNLVWLLAMQTGRPAEAKTLIDQGIARAGRLPTLLDTRGTVYLKMNLPAE